MQLSHTIIPYTIISASGEAQHRVRKKETEIVPEWAGLMNTKVRDPVDMAELRALNLRKSKKQELVSKRRGLFGNKTPTERSVYPRRVGTVSGILLSKTLRFVKMSKKYSVLC
jgi:hypothetical protein